MQISAYEGDAFGEPAHDMKPVQDVFRVAEMSVDGGLVGLRPVRDHHLNSTTPARALLNEERLEGFGVAVLDHGEDLAGLAVLDDGDVTVAFTHRGLIDEQHPGSDASVDARLPAPTKR